MSAYTPGDAAEYGCLSCGALPPVRGSARAHYCSLQCLHDDEHSDDHDCEDCPECREIRGEDEIAEEPDRVAL